MFKSILKRTLSTMLALTLAVTTFCIVGPSGAFTAQAAASHRDPAYPNNLFFVVPEAIYLAPVHDSGVATTTSAFQYYVDESFNGTSITNRIGEQPTGNVYFYYPDSVGDVEISFRWQSEPGADLSSDAAITLTGSSSVSFASGESFTTQSSTEPILITDGTSPFMAPSQSGVYIEWTATYTDTVDGQTKTAYAYTYVYKPYVYPIGVAQRSVNNRGTNHYGQSISWISGVHDTLIERNNYPTVNTDYGFLPFSSGSPEPQLPDYFKSTGISGVGCSKWVDGNSSSAPDKSCIYFASTESAHLTGDDEVLNFAYSATGLLTVDTSRYQNLDQIPNLTLGMLVTDDESSDADTAAYFVSNVTSSKYDADYTDYWKTSDNTADTYWNAYYSADKINFSGNYPDVMTASEKEGVKFNVRWDKNVPNASGIQYLGTGYANKSGNDTIVNVAELRCQVNVYDKSTLRSAYQNAMTSFAKNNAELLNAGNWNAFIALYRAVAKELCKVDGTFQTVTVNGTQYATPAALASALNTMTATCSAFNASVRSTYTATQKNVKVYNDGGWKLAAAVDEETASGYFKGAQLTFTPDSFDGYTFAGYRTTAESQMNVGSLTDGQADSVTDGVCTIEHANGNETVSFYYIRTEYTIYFDANSGDYISPMVYNIDSAETLPAATRSGYSFGGWQPVESTGAWSAGTTYDAGTSLSGKSGDVTLRALWIGNSYTITFDTNGGNAVEPMEYTTTDTSTLPSATRAAYTFNGWIAGSTTGNWQTGVLYVAGSSVEGMVGNVTMTAEWAPIEYRITFNTSGGSAYPAKNYTIESTDTLGTPTKGGYAFQGWTVTTSAGNWAAGTYDASQSLTGKYGNVSMTAQWTETQYTITFNSQGGSAVDSITYSLDTQIQLPEPEREAYMFNGWRPDNASGSWQDTFYNTSSVYTGMYGDVTLNAQWAARGYAITFDSKGGDPVDDMNYNVIMSFELPNTARNGYLLDGWTPKTSVGNWDASVKYAPCEMMQGMYGNVTLAAVWKAAEHTHTYSAYVTFPTCTEDGYTKYVCDYCGDWYIDNIVSATGHNPGEAVSENFRSATCTEDGGYDEVVYCLNCGGEVSRNPIVFPAYGHYAGESVRENYVEATCQHEGGYDEIVYCVNCGEVMSQQTVTLPKLDHMPDIPVRENEVPSTCAQNGSYDEVVYCTVCGDAISRETHTLPLVDHTPGAPMVGTQVAPTCTADGYHDEYVYCSVCGEFLSYEMITDTGSALGHDFSTSPWYADPDVETQHMRACSRCGASFEYAQHNFDSFVQEPSCTADGVIYYTCQDCGYSYTEPGESATGHEWSEWLYDDEDESGAYEHVRYCVKCEKEFESAPHNFVRTEVPASCTSAGTVYFTCADCGYSYSEPGQSALGHDWSEWLYDDEDESSAYQHVRYCVRCEKEIESEPHNYVENAQLSTPATCTAAGVRRLVCEGCGHVIEQEIPMADHTPGEPVRENEVPATASADGSYDEVVYCTVCLAELSREAHVIPASGHTHTPGEPVRENEVAPTCTVDGSYDAVVYCTECGEEISRETVTVSATGHDYDAVVTAPACLTQGYTTYTCKHNPAHTYTDDFVPALGHNWSDWVVTTAPTATAAGEETRTCARCGATETRRVDPLIKDGMLALSEATAHPGETVQITVSVQNNPGIVSAMLKIGYDASVLTLIGIENSGLLTGADFYAGNDTTANPYTAFWVNSLAQQDYTQNGTLATLTFKVADDAPAGATQVTITYSMGSTFNHELRPVPFILQNGAVDVKPILLGDANCDGEITLLDVVLIERYLAGGWGVTIDEINADVDGEDGVTLKDVTLIARYLAGGWGVEL